MNELTARLLFVAACIVVPVLWGVLINWLFDLWQSRGNGRENEEPIFPDYQI